MAPPEPRAQTWPRPRTLTWVKAGWTEDRDKPLMKVKVHELDRLAVARSDTGTLFLLVKPAGEEEVAYALREGTSPELCGVLSRLMDEDARFPVQGRA